MSDTWPALYHAHHARHMDDLDFWQALARQQGSPLLELGCGSGRLLVPLAKAGYSVYGLDIDRSMLAFARHILEPTLSAQVRLIQADLCHFHLAQAFPLILVPCNTWSTLPPPSRQAALECITRHLPAGGIFAASLPNPLLLKRLPQQSAREFEEDFPHPEDGEPVEVSSGWKRKGNTFSVTWDYDHLLPDGSVRRVSLQVEHNLSDPEEYTAELRQAGLVPLTRYGDFDSSPFSPESPYLILLAGKT